jgi:hypothetical protein
MRKLLLIGLCLLFILGNKPTTDTQQETTVPLSDILLYCNTPEFVRNMAENDYMLGLAASGVVNDDKHRMLLSMELLMNPRNRQWAVIFNYARGNLSCIIGGNRIELFIPKN